MSPRTGRPPKQGEGNSRTAKKLNIRLTEAEYESIEKVAESLNVSKTDAILQGIELLKKKIEKKK